MSPNWMPSRPMSRIACAGEDVRGRVHRHARGVIEIELRLDQPSVLGVGGEENEVNVLPRARFEPQLLSDRFFDQLLARLALGDVEQVLDRLGKVDVLLAVGLAGDHYAAEALPVTGPRRHHALAPRRLRIKHGRLAVPVEPGAVGPLPRLPFPPRGGTGKKILWRGPVRVG